MGDITLDCAYAIGKIPGIRLLHTSTSTIYLFIY
jgi:hypothetical protein